MKRDKDYPRSLVIENCPPHIPRSYINTVSNLKHKTHQDKKFVNGSLVIDLVYGTMTMSMNGPTLVVSDIEPHHAPLLPLLSAKDWSDLLSGRRAAADIFVNIGKTRRVIFMVRDREGFLIPSVVMRNGDEEMTVGYDGDKEGLVVRDIDGGWRLAA